MEKYFYRYHVLEVLGQILKCIKSMELQTLMLSKLLQSKVGKCYFLIIFSGGLSPNLVLMVLLQFKDFHDVYTRNLILDILLYKN